ncbi:MAG: hypothetical protein IPK04_13820 [Bdellovibrionales bacterium]|jgi:hypothetical protein|nr:hypothetical protein [Bdellovibrionales bacterium]
MVIRILFPIGILFASLNVHSSYKYAECRCSVDFLTPAGDTMHVSDYVYCPESEEYSFTCYGHVVGWSLDTMCDNAAGETSKSPNWDPPRLSTEIPGTLSCSM